MTEMANDTSTGDTAAVEIETNEIENIKDDDTRNTITSIRSNTSKSKKSKKSKKQNQILNETVATENQMEERRYSITSLSAEQYKKQLLKKETQKLQQKEEEINLYDDNVSIRSIIFQESEEEPEKSLAEIALLKEIYDDVTDSSEETSTEELEDIDSMPFTDFLDNVNMPELETLEQDEEDKEEIKKRGTSVVKTKPTGDTGHFVDPLTGGYISSDDSAHESEESVEEEEEEEEEEEYDDIDLPEVEDFDTVKPKMSEHEIADETFQKIFFAEKVDSSETQEEIEAKLRLKEQFELRQNLEDFLKYLIDRVVTKLEYVGPIDILRNYLDKKKLLKEIIVLVKCYKEEERKRIMFNRAAVNYFRRKKNFRCIREDIPQEIEEEMHKYNISHEILIEQMNKQKKWIDAISRKTTELNNIENDCAVLLRTDVSDLEQLIMKTFSTGRSDKMQKEVEILIKKMARERDNLSKARFSFLITLHILTSQKAKLSRIESITPELTVNNFITLQTDVNSMDKKIEERSRQLLKDRYKYYEELHIIAHMQDTIITKHRQLHALSNLNKNIYEGKRKLRDHMYDLKLESIKMHRETENLISNNGLLNTPILMFDFDKTKENYATLAKQNLELKKKIAALKTF